MHPEKPLAGSFRDPSGFVFEKDGSLYRQVNRVYQESYDQLMASGLYRSLVDDGLLVAHQEVDAAGDAYKIIKPERIGFVSYPYEWCFSQLKNAALTTLEIQKRSLERGMSLKDASAYNIQFQGTRPVLIDTLSFEPATKDRPWVAYRQFCQHFLAPLALMSKKDVRLGQLLRVHLDGIPLDLASRLLPWRTRLRFTLLTHLHLHARSQKRYAGRPVDASSRRMNPLALQGLIDSLRSAVSKLRWRPRGTEWAGYYDASNYSERAFAHKRELVTGLLQAARPASVWDLGANTGEFSKIAGELGIMTVGFDADPAAVERHYQDAAARSERRVLPLQVDLTNPSGGGGWENTERLSLLERGPADAVLALALIHHLCISNNLPLVNLAEFFSRLCRKLIIEFVPKSDSQVERLLASRRDIFPGYTQPGFESAFGRHFSIERQEPLAESERILYLMVRK